MESCNKTVLFIYYGVLMFLSFQVSYVSSATDTIFTNQSLARDETITSSNDVFDFGFFSPNPDSNNDTVYLAIWYRFSSPRTTVWVSNRGYFTSSMIYSSEYFVKISNGNVLLHRNSTGETIWSTGVKSSRSKDVRAVLLDNGNLVLQNGPSSSAAVLWQSFDHPTDTWLPGAKFKLGSYRLTSWKTSTDPSLGLYTLEVDPITNNSLISVWNGSKSYWTSGTRDDPLKYFKGIAIASFKMSLDGSYITYSIHYNHDNPYRVFMSVSGQLHLELVLDSSLSRPWNLFWSEPLSSCDVYNYCGSFGICNDTQYPHHCRCVPGYRQVFPQVSDPSDFSSGCERETKLQCDKRNNNFLPIENMKLATDPTTMVLTPNLVTRCASACLANCSCKAYAFDGNNCLMWRNEAFNLEELNATKGEGHTFFLRVASSNITTQSSDQGKTKDRIIVLPAIISSLVVVAVLLLVGFYCCISSRRRRRNRSQKDKRQSREILGGGIIDDDGENMCYLNLHDIMTATNAFSEENKLGEGGFGKIGYMSPEYALGGIISEKSVIYSFGVLLLEIISGKKATKFVHNDQKHSLITYAWDSWCETKGVNIIDEALCDSYSLIEAMRCVHIALLCVQDHPYDRPMISQIVYMLSNDNDLPIPKQPTFSNVLNGNQQLVSSDYVFSINEVTQTEVEAR